MLLANIFSGGGLRHRVRYDDRLDDLKIGIKTSAILSPPRRARGCCVMPPPSRCWLSSVCSPGLEAVAWYSVLSSPARSPATTTPLIRWRARPRRLLLRLSATNNCRRRDLRRPSSSTSCCAPEPCRRPPTTDPALHDRPPRRLAAARQPALRRFLTPTRRNASPTCRAGPTPSRVLHADHRRHRRPGRCCFKPQIAYFAAHRAEDQLEAHRSSIIHAAHPDTPVIPTPSAATSAAPPSSTPSRPSSAYKADAITASIPTWVAARSIPYLAWPDKGVILHSLPHLQPGRSTCSSSRSIRPMAA